MFVKVSEELKDGVIRAGRVWCEKQAANSVIKYYLEEWKMEMWSNVTGSDQTMGVSHELVLGLRSQRTWSQLA